MLPVINAFKTAHQSDRCHRGRRCRDDLRSQPGRAAGRGVVLHPRRPHPVSCPMWCANGATNTPTRRSPIGLVLTQPWPATSSEKARGIPDRVIHYQYRHDRARRTLRGIDEQVAKAQRAVDGHAAVKRNRLHPADRGDQEREPRRWRPRPARWPGGRDTPPTSSASPPTFVIDAYHQLWRIEKAFRMSKHDLQARPIYHRTRDSIDAHLTHRVRRPGRQPLDRDPNRLEHQEIRAHRTPLPHRTDPGRPTNPDRRRTPTRRPRRSPRQHQQPRCALIWPNSGLRPSSLPTT